MVHGTLEPMMYDPNYFTLNLEQILSGVPLDAAIGVLQVVVRSARDIKGAKLGGGTPDPYVSLTFNDRGELAKTKHKLNTSVVVICVTGFQADWVSATTPLGRKPSSCLSIRFTSPSF